MDVWGEYSIMCEYISFELSGYALNLVKAVREDIREKYEG